MALKKQVESKLKLDFKLAEEALDLKQLSTNIIIQQLEENIKLRELPIEMHAKKKLLQ